MHSSLSSLSHAFRRIVVATDFSEFATVALLRAAALTREAGGSLLLVHVTGPQQHATSTEGVPFVLREQSHEDQLRLEAAARPLRDFGVPYQTSLRHGSVRECLKQAVHEWDADALVVGTHGEMRFGHEVCASMAERVLRAMPCPVLVLGPHAWLTPEITLHAPILLVPTDFSESSARVLPYVDALAHWMHARVTLLHVPNGPRTRSQTSRLHDMADTLLHTRMVDCVVEPGDLAAVIAQTARVGNVEMIVLGVHREDLRQAPRGGLHVGLVYRILSRTGAPILTIQEDVEILRLRAFRSLPRVPQWAGVGA
jgi:nucleotide-binding universal stress UspA family protein